MNLWTVGCADPRLTAQARSLWTSRGNAIRFPTLPTGWRLPTSFTAPLQQDRINSIPGKIKPSAGYQS